MSEVLISEVRGNNQLLDGGAMFGNAPKVLWEKWITPDALNRIPLACRALLIEAEGDKFLCETGIGAFFEPKLAERFGVQAPERHLLLENLKQLGVKEEDIDFVILSHLHFDHAGGLLPSFKDISAGQDRLLFPFAKYIVGKDAWARAKDPHPRDKASFIPGLTQKLENSGRLLIIESEIQAKAISPRLEFIISNGHTPGQMHTLFQGQESKIFFAGDLIPGTAWVHLPITMGYDRFPELLIEEKRHLYQRACSEKWWVFYTHDDKVAMSKIEETAQRFTPLEVRQDLVRCSI